MIDQYFANIEDIFNKLELAQQDQKLNNNDLSQIGSMTALTFYGFVEDYMKELKNEILTIKIKINPNFNDKKFNKKFRRKGFTDKSFFLLQSIGTFSVYEKMIRKYNMQEINDNFDKFRQIRNKLAHSSYKLDLADFNLEMVNIMNYLRLELQKQSPSPFNELFEPYLPQITFGYLIQMKIYSYLLIIDNLFFIWSKNQ